MTNLPYVFSVEPAQLLNQGFMWSCLGLIALAEIVAAMFSGSLRSQFDKADAPAGDFDIPIAKYERFCKVFLPLYTVLCLLVYGPGMAVLRSIIVSAAILYLGYCDNRTHEVDHYNFAILFAAGLIGQEWDTATLMNVGSSFLIALGIAAVVVYLFHGIGFGGADALLIATAGMSMSFYPSAIATILGLAAFVGHIAIRNHGVVKGQSYAMTMYLGGAFLLMNLVTFLF